MEAFWIDNLSISKGGALTCFCSDIVLQVLKDLKLGI